MNTPSGKTITNVAPDDHPHHRGIFLGFLESEFRIPAEFSKARPDYPVKVFDIQRGDFWSWGFYAPRDSRVIQNRNIKLAIADAKRAQLEINNEWLIENKKLLDETDKITVSARYRSCLPARTYRGLRSQAAGIWGLRGPRPEGW